MILLPVDESYFFDYLSILQIKDSHCLDIYFTYLDTQITKDKTNYILSSPEYGNLKNINQELFDLIDKCKTENIYASEIDELNYKRWEAKKLLQERFFKNNPITEQKIGY